LKAFFRFFAELNDFLPLNRREVWIPYDLNGPVAVKHPIEALGIPHPEVDAILANGQAVGFSYRVQAGDNLEVYPGAGESEDDSQVHLRPALSYPPRFILDNHLGRLATYLRLFGFDALYPDESKDENLAQVSGEEGRVLLTRDQDLLKRKAVIYGYWLRSKDPRQQLLAVFQRYRLKASIRPWRRCLRCNGHLRPVAKEDILERLEPKTRLYYHEFHMCQQCRQIYWKGTHYEPLKRFVEGIRQDLDWSGEVKKGS
jgi:uncharacterized protein with PIN domain